MRDIAKRNFILQQGFEKPEPSACSVQYSALNFQPRIVLIWLIAGTVFHSAALFGILCPVLWWSALFPKLNPFDALYNATAGRKPGAFRLSPRQLPEGSRRQWRASSRLLAMG
jgi:hypothetical protein